MPEQPPERPPGGADRPSGGTTPPHGDPLSPGAAPPPPGQPPPPGYAPPPSGPPGYAPSPGPPPPAPPGQQAPPAPGYAPPPGLVGELAVKRSGVRCGVAGTVSLGVYTFWWFYQYRRRISAELGRTDDAGLHTAGLFVPILNYYLTYLLWRDIGEARTRVGLNDVPAVPYVIATIFVGPIVYFLVNAELNEYWDRRTGGTATEAPWTTAEKLVTILPGIFFVALIVLIVLIAVAASA